MKITIEGVNYEINIEKAKEMGLCAEIRKPIENFRVGDVFERTSGGYKLRTLISQSIYGYKKEDRYNIAGLYGLELFSDLRDRCVSKKELLKFLNEHDYKFVKNINGQINSLVKD